MRLDRPIGWLLLLWPTWLALWGASQGQPSLRGIVVFTVGVIVMRSAGCVINDWADRHVDGKVKRTCHRPIVSGQVNEKEAMGLLS
jgi:4-hydroxybenzoate polyprenyltransferase